MDLSARQIKGIGAVEVLGALGLALHAIGGIAPGLVPVATTVLAIVMVVATIMHVRRGDPAAATITTIVLALLSAFVAWGRFGPHRSDHGPPCGGRGQDGRPPQTSGVDITHVRRGTRPPCVHAVIAVP